MKNLKFWIGIVLSLIFLWLSIRGVNWPEVVKSFAKVNYLYLAAGILVLILANFFRALRWRSLLGRIKVIPIYDLFSIIMIANLLLNTLPARIGEVMRAYLLGKKYDISKTSCFSTIVVERVFDGCFAMSFFVVALWIYPGDISISVPGVPHFSVKKAIYTLSLIYAAALIFLLLLKMFPAHVKRVLAILLHYFPEGIKSRGSSLADSFISGLSVFNDFRHLFLSLIISGIVWILLPCFYYLGLLGFGIEKDFYLNFILMGFIVIAVMIPAAPGYIGIFHFSVQMTLQKFFNVSPSVALSYAWVMWVCGMVVNVIPGLFYYNKYNLQIAKIREMELLAAAPSAQINQ